MILLYFFDFLHSPIRSPIFYDSLISLFCILDQIIVNTDFSRLDEEDYCGTSEFEVAFFLAFLYCGRIFMEICDFSYHHGAYFHHEDGSELFCFQQSVFSGVFFVDGIYIVCCRIHCVENAGQSYIRGFSSICHIAVMMIVIYCQSENQRIAACVSLSNCLILQKLSCCIFCIFGAET